MRDNKVIGTIAGVVALGSAAGIFFSLSGSFAPPIDPTPYRAVGRALARQTLACLKPGGHITVITRDTVTFQNPASDFQLAGFRQELAKAGVKIESLQALQIDPLRPTEVPAGDFLQWIKKASKDDVLVSFMGPPIFSEAQFAQLSEIKPAVVAFCSGPARDQADLRALFSRGVLRAAVVSKRNASVPSAPPAGERELFDRQFVEVTPANLSALPGSSTGAP